MDLSQQIFYVTQFNKFINTLKKEKEEMKGKCPWLELDNERRNMSDRELWISM